MNIRTTFNCDSFMYNQCPKIIKYRLLGTVARLDKSQRDKLNKDLKEKYNVDDIYDIICLYYDNIIINKNMYRTIYNISLKPNILIKEKYLQGIVDFIDYGDINHKGYNLFNRTLNYICNNFMSLYKYYSLGVR